MIKLPKKFFIISLITTIVLSVVISFLTVSNLFLQPYSRVLIALDYADIKKSEVNKTIDLLLEEDYIDLDYNHIDYLNITRISGRLGRIIPPKSIANFIKYYLNPPKQSTPLIFIALKYHNNKIKQLSDKYQQKEPKTIDDSISELYHYLFSETFKQDTSIDQFKNDLPLLAEFYFKTTRLISEERINAVLTKLLSDQFNAISFRDLIYFSLQLSQELVDFTSDRFKLIINYFLDISANLSIDLDSIILDMLKYSEGIIAIANYLSLQTEQTLLNLFLDFPDINKITNNLKEAIKSTEYFSLHQKTIADQVDTILEYIIELL